MSTTSAPVATRQELITNKIDKEIAGALSISREAGGMAFSSMAEVMELAKLMAVSQHAVPPHCRNNPGLCLGLAIQSVEWRLSPFAVANKSYVVNDRIGYESQLIHAVIEQRAPITCRLRHSFSGEGGKRRCKVWATAKGESEPLIYESPEFDKITPKNSPLWKSKPDMQLYYNASRDWARMYFPDVILGVYAEDELDTIPQHPSAPLVGGMAGLKNRLSVASAPEDNPADDVQQQEQEGVDPPHNDADTDQGEPGDPQGMTAEEMRDQEREARGDGTLFNAHGNVGQ